MNKLMKYDPFGELRAWQRHFLGDDWFNIRGMSIPTTDVYTHDDQLIVEAHLPNFEQNDIDIHIEDNALVISAERHEKEEDKERKYVIRESSTSFYRRVQLPGRADSDSIDARLEDGVLKVRVPLTPLPEPKKIEVKGKSK